MNFNVISFNRDCIEKIKQDRISKGKEDFVNFEKHFRVGDVISVSYYIADKKNGKSKICKFQGTCIKKRPRSNGFIVENGLNERKVTIIFYYFSPNLDRIDVVKKAE